MSGIDLKFKKMWLKLLKAQCNRKWEKARKLHAKIIGLELEVKVRERENGKLN